MLIKGWRLPQIITTAVQIGQSGTMIFLFTKIYYPNLISFKAILSLKFIVTLTCTILVSFYWKSTVFFLGENRSLGIIIITLIISLCGYFKTFKKVIFYCKLFNTCSFLDGSTTIAAIPFITNEFKKEYIIPYYIGETLMRLTLI